MRHLVLLRGPMGAGKDTYIKEQNLETYTLSADDIRLLFQSPKLNNEGGYSVEANNDHEVWKLLFKLLEKRMMNGELVVINATHIRRKAINAYRKLVKEYRYRVSVVDLTDGLTEEILLERNKTREAYKRLPEDVVLNAFEIAKNKDIPTFAEVVKPDELAEVLTYTKKDLSEYKKIHHIGDIHGSNTVLQEYLKGGLKDDEFYIFTGDYIDRGVENVEVISFLLEIYEQPNVILLEGNHEFHLRNYANDKAAVSREFEKRTLPLIEKAIKENVFTAGDLRNLTRKLHQLVYYSYNEKTVLVTHGGLSTLPENLMTISSSQLIKGVGNYNDDIDELWNLNTAGQDHLYQIHGHRNVYQLPIENGKSFNLEGDVEYGGELRVVTLSADGFEPIEIKNTVFKESSPVDKNELKLKENITMEEYIRSLEGSKYIEKKKAGNSIYSFNFTRKAFHEKAWNELSIRARGLFINTEKNEIVARSYDKFFNLEERQSTKLFNLVKTIKFPLIGYEKPNGYLGIVSYYNDKFFFASKSSIFSSHAKWLEELFYKTFNDKQQEALKSKMIEGYTAIFEVVLPEKDPHIIKYDTDELILLDFVKNEIHFETLPFEKLKEFSKTHRIRSKEELIRFDDWVSFYKWVQKNKSTFDILHEGFVFEDQNKFMFKYKSYYYSSWKYLRSTLERYVARGESFKYVNDQRSVALSSLVHIQFTNWLFTKDPKDLVDKSIIEVRDEFYNR